MSVRPSVHASQPSVRFSWNSVWNLFKIGYRAAMNFVKNSATKRRPTLYPFSDLKFGTGYVYKIYFVIMSFVKSCTLETKSVCNHTFHSCCPMWINLVHDICSMFLSICELRGNASRCFGQNKTTLTSEPATLWHTWIQSACCTTECRARDDKPYCLSVCLYLPSSTFEKVDRFSRIQYDVLLQAMHYRTLHFVKSVLRKWRTPKINKTKVCAT